MKRLFFNYLIIAVVAVSAAFTSCNKNNIDNGNGNENESEKWVKKRNYQGAQGDHVLIFSINNKIYASSQNTLWEYDPAYNTWTDKKDSPNTYPTAYFVANNKVYIIGSSNNVWEYNPLIDNWTEKSSCPVNFSNFGFGINNKGYVCNSYTRDFYEYDTETDTWKECANFPNIINSGIACGSTTQNGFTIGGYNTGTIFNDCFYMYNPTADKWTQKANFPILTSQGIAFCNDDVIYAGLGYYVDRYTLINYLSKKIYKYDTESNSWSFAIEAPIQSIAGNTVMCNGKLYLLDGIDFWEYSF